VPSASSLRLKLTPGHQSRSTSPSTGSADNKSSADSHTNTRSPPDSPTLLQEEAGHRHDRVFEPNRSRHGLLHVTLDHGDPLDDSAPLVEITTRYRDLTDLAPDQALGELAHNDAAIRRGDWRDWRAWYGALRDDTEADPPGPVTSSDADILIEGERCTVAVLTHGDYQAATFTRNGLAGTVASRHYAIDQLSLARVPTIAPYLDEYMAFLREMPQRLRTRPGTT
jgi:hypothetical protein